MYSYTYYILYIAYEYEIHVINHKLMQKQNPLP